MDKACFIGTGLWSTYADWLDAINTDCAIIIKIINHLYKVINVKTVTKIFLGIIAIVLLYNIHD